MRTLVTGGAGYIGGTVANFLAQNGNKVIIFDDLSMGCYLQYLLFPNYQQTIECVFLYHLSHLLFHFINLAMIFLKNL